VRTGGRSCAPRRPSPFSGPRPDLWRRDRSSRLVGQTYGVDGSGNPFYHAFIYSGGAFQDLNNLIPAGSGWELTDATAINDKGQIAANGYSATTGKTHAFLLNPM